MRSWDGDVRWHKVERLARNAGYRAEAAAEVQVHRAIRMLRIVGDVYLAPNAADRNRRVNVARLTRDCGVDLLGTGPSLAAVGRAEQEDVRTARWVAEERAVRGIVSQGNVAVLDGERWLDG